MSDKPLAHPLKWWQFYVACVRHAGSGVLGVIGDVGTIIGVIVYSFKVLAPTYYATVGAYLTTHGYRENALIEIPLWAGAVILFARLLTAPFVIYRDKPSSDVATGILRNKALRLSTEIVQFVTMREATQPTSGSLFMYNKEGMQRWADAQREQATHSHATGQLYYERFAERVLDIRQEFAQVGIVDDKLEAVYINPALNDGIATIGAQLRAMADRLSPDVLPSHELAFGHLREENSSLRREVDDLKVKTQQRRLDDEASKVLTSRLQAGLVDLRQQMIDASWDLEDIERRMLVKLVAIGSDRETVAYRLDLKKAFEAGGFDVLLGDRAAGNAQDEDLVGAVSVVRGKPGNRVIPFVVDALQTAGVTTREVEGLPYGRWLHEQLQNDPMQNLGAIVVVGPRE